MSGESQRDTEPDFLDDDFILEDVAAKNEGLDQLFEMPHTAKVGPASEAKSAVDPDADDMLFTDHTHGLVPTASFQGGPPFSESQRSSWTSDGLDLEAVGVPAAEPETGETEAAVLAGAQASFTAELDSLLQSGDDFALDSDKELELVDGDEVDGAQFEGAQSDSAKPGAVSGDGISEFEQSGPFVIDDGEGAWQDESAETDFELGVPAEPALSAEDDGEVQPGWEPLAPASVDELAEVGEVERADGEPELAASGEAAGAYAEDDIYGEGEKVAPIPAGRRPTANAATAEGHDLYATEETAAVIGARAPRGRSGRLLIVLAASLMVVSAGAVVVLRPEWLGLELVPERMQQAQVSRPLVAVVVPTPSLPVAPPMATPSAGAVEPNAPPASHGAAPTGAAPTGTAPTGTAPTGTTPTGTTPTTTVPPEVQPPTTTVPPEVQPPTTTVPPEVATPTTTPVVVAVDPPPTATTAPAAVPSVPEGATPVEPPTAATPDPAASVPASGTEPLVVVPAPAPENDGPRWPVPLAGGTPDGGAPVSSVPNTAQLVRVNEDLLIGEREEVARPVKAVEGVLPGSRAFAQLHNGNYFIGSVKCVDAERLTLRIDTGEVTLPVAAIARITELGSTDYDDLQRVTSGFVRLTNNNRLVGGILSHIADDHVVLEFRSNRVMLPRSAVGQVVQGEGDAGVRLDTTREEDDWLRRLIERQLGSGTGAAPPVKSTPAPTGGGRTPR